METLQRLKEITAVLRGPHGCEWDRAQDLSSMKPHLIEEAYEVLDAIENADPENLKEELGDLLFLVMFFSRLAEELQWFDLSAVAEGAAEKLVRRHPHVFGDVNVNGVGEILENWEAIKQEEKSGDKDKPNGLMDGVSRTMPALMRSLKSQQKAARVGFDWNNADGVFEKLNEEFQEVQQAYKEAGTYDVNLSCPLDLEDEVGDLLFTAVNLARKVGADPETVLNRTVDRFQDRFRLMETYAARSFAELKDLSTDTLEEYWQKAKKEQSDRVRK